MVFGSLVPGTKSYKIFIKSKNKSMFLLKYKFYSYCYCFTKLSFIKLLHSTSFHGPPFDFTALLLWMLLSLF